MKSHFFITIILCIGYITQLFAQSDQVYWPDGSNQAPIFAKGKISWIDFAKNHVKPSFLYSNYNEFVMVGFIVEKNGKITDFKTLIPPNGYQNNKNWNLCCDEITRLLIMSPIFSPGKVNNIPVRMYQTYTLYFGKELTELMPADTIPNDHEVEVASSTPIKNEEYPGAEAPPEPAIEET